MYHHPGMQLPHGHHPQYTTYPPHMHPQMHHPQMHQQMHQPMHQQMHQPMHHHPHATHHPHTTHHHSMMYGGQHPNQNLMSPMSSLPSTMISSQMGKKTKKKLKDPNAPKKASTAFMLWSLANRSRIREQHPEMGFADTGNVKQGKIVNVTSVNNRPI
jgi:hypothetical protein